MIWAVLKCFGCAINSIECLGLGVKLNLFEIDRFDRNRRGGITTLHLSHDIGLEHEEAYIVDMSILEEEKAVGQMLS